MENSMDLFIQEVIKTKVEQSGFKGNADAVSVGLTDIIKYMCGDTIVSVIEEAVDRLSKGVN